jgi:hypothetical protein
MKHIASLTDDQGFEAFVGEDAPSTLAIEERFALTEGNIG